MALILHPLCGLVEEPPKGYRVTVPGARSRSVDLRTFPEVLQLLTELDKAGEQASSVLNLDRQANGATAIELEQVDAEVKRLADAKLATAEGVTRA